MKRLTGLLGALTLLASTGLHAQTSGPALERAAASQDYHPPSMPGMDMDDAANQHFFFVDNLEAVYGNHNGGAWDVQGWYGGDFNKLWAKSEGQTLGDRTADSKVEALWARALLPFWDTQLGMRYDFSGGPSREWLAFGVQGISPYWFDIEATGYVRDAGRTAARFKVEYALYLTQRLILKPAIELNAYGKADPERNIGAGLSSAQFELRLRYEFTRGFAPYLGFVWDRKLGATATYARREGESAVDHRLAAGLQFFF
ncbi:MAG: copper resistance protein B [Pseudomonadota bacterium]|nr:copper resistance protein B [Pseudomonadota bacterium]